MGCGAGDEAARAAEGAYHPDDLRPASAEALTVLRTYLRRQPCPRGPPNSRCWCSMRSRIADAVMDRAGVSRACQMKDQITIRQVPQASLAIPMHWVDRHPVQEEPLPT